MSRLSISIDLAQYFQGKSAGTYSRAAIVQAEILFIRRVHPNRYVLD